MAGSLNANAKKKLEVINDLVENAFNVCPELETGLRGRKDADFSRMVDLISDIKNGCSIPEDHADFDEMLSDFDPRFDDMIVSLETAANDCLTKHTSIRTEENQGAAQVLRFCSAAKDCMAEFRHERGFTTDVNEKTGKLLDANKDLTATEKFMNTNLQSCYDSAAEAQLDFYSEIKKKPDLSYQTLSSFASELESAALSAQNSHKEALNTFDQNIKSANEDLNKRYQSYKKAKAEGPQAVQMSGYDFMQMKNDTRDLFKKTPFTINILELNPKTLNYDRTTLAYDTMFRESIEKLNRAELDARIAAFTPERKAALQAESERIAPEYERLRQISLFGNQFASDYSKVTDLLNYDPDIVDSYSFQASSVMLQIADCDPLLATEIKANLQGMAKLAEDQAQYQSEYKKAHNGSLDVEKFNQYQKDMNDAFAASIQTFRTSDGRKLDDVMKRYNELSRVVYESDCFDKRLDTLKAYKEMMYGKEGYVTRVNDANKKTKDEYDNNLNDVLAGLQKDARNIVNLNNKLIEYKISGDAKVNSVTNYYIAVNNLSKVENDRSFYASQVSKAKENLHTEISRVKDHENRSSELTANTRSNEYEKLFTDMSAISASHFFGHRNTDRFNQMMTSLTEARDLVKANRPLTDAEKETIRTAMERVTGYVQKRGPKNGDRFKGTDQGQKRYDIACNLKKFFEENYGPDPKHMTFNKTDLQRAENADAMIPDAKKNYVELDQIIENTHEKMAEKAKGKRDEYEKNIAANIAAAKEEAMKKHSDAFKSVQKKDAVNAGANKDSAKKAPVKPVLKA